MVDWEAAHVDWAPLQAVLSEDALADWMWMYAAQAEDGARVHCYKHVWTRRSLRLDEQGRVYAESPDGTPRRLPGCGGATLLLSLVATTAICDVSVGPEIRVPEGAQEPTTMDDLPAFLELLWAIASDVGGVLEALDRSAAKVGSR